MTGVASQPNHHHTHPRSWEILCPPKCIHEVITHWLPYNNNNTFFFFIEPLLYALHSLGPQNSSGTEEETGSAGCHLVIEAGFEPKPT